MYSAYDIRAMRFYSIDEETREVLRVTESRTVRECSRCAGIAIGRWLLSGLPLPDQDASDGVSEEEAVLGVGQ